MGYNFTWVYLVFDPYTSLFKIGRSDNPQERIKQLCNPSNYGTIPAAPTEYELLEAWLTRDSMESFFHQRFAEYRVRGEWFDLYQAFNLYAPTLVLYKMESILPDAIRLKRGGTHNQDRVDHYKSNYEELERQIPMLERAVQYAALKGFSVPQLNPAPSRTVAHLPKTQIIGYDGEPVPF